MKKFFKKMISLTGMQYFLISLFSMPTFIVVGYFTAKIADFFGIDLFGDAFFAWGMTVIAIYAILSIKGATALFRAPSLKDRMWLWIGLAINLFILYILLFAGSDLSLPLI